MSGRFTKVLALVGLAGAIAFVVKQFAGRDTEPIWHSTPVAVPNVPTQSEGSAGSGGKHAADDASGSTPDEAAADAAEEPHQVTTPDAPAETVILED